jgi:hypothetical protein
MSNGILPLPPIEVAQRAAAELARESAGNTSQVHAVNKAAFMLARGAVEVVHGFDGFLITSATRVGVVHRVSTVNGCGCEAGAAGKACWHAATVAILERSGKYTMPRMETAPLGRPMAERIADARSAAYKRAMAEMDEVFG